ncbi:MAG TPA: MCE family protein [Nocardioides sp.]|nr:MCE family protein [Nocardioides sp.]
MAIRLAGVGLSVAALALSGCGVLSGGVYDAPLPGGADVGDDPMTVTAEFSDVLDLVPQSSVKVDNVAVGRVTDITLSADGRTAEVEMEVRGDLDLPGDTLARLQQTSLLGEKYVALIRPDTSKPGSVTAAALADGAVLSTGETDAAATAEQVLGALSLVLNGGGVAQFQEISRELQQVGGEGRTEDVRAFLDELNRFVGVLDRRRDAITGAIDGLARLGKSLDDDREQIVTVLDDLSPGMAVLAEQRPQLTRMLTALDRLSKVTVRTLNASQKDMVRDLELLDPILSELAKAGADLPHALEILLTYPFPDSVMGAIRGDYLNVFMTTNFRTLPAGCAAIGCWWPQPSAGSPAVGSGRSSGSGQPPPAILPSTDTATPGIPSSTVPGPSILPTDPTDPTDPTGSTGSPSPSGSSGSASPSGSATSESGSTGSAGPEGDQ